MRGYQDSLLNELIVDNFAGGGGASIGIELAVGRPVDIAVNHDADAVAMHKVNHQYTQHFQEDVFAIDPEKVTGGRPVGIAWFSPDCKHFSKAKGGTPVEKRIRGLSWVILRWAMSEVSPRIIFMENVEEIQTWGPLIETYPEGKDERCCTIPDPKRKGETFNAFVKMLSTGLPKDHPALEEACEFLGISKESKEADRLSNGLGYKVAYKVLKACDYGAPTIRKRFYLVARRDGEPIVFPEPTHGEDKGLKPYKTAAECIDWSLPCPSIFGRKKELADNTKRRIARGLDKFVLKNPRPYIMEMNYQNSPQDPLKPLTTQTTANHHYLITPEIVQIGQTGRTQDRSNRINDPLRTLCVKNEHCIVAPSVIQYHSEQSGKEVRGQKIQEPIMTVDGSPRYGLNACFISKYFSGEKQAGADIREPMPTVTAIDHNAAVAVHLMSRHGDGSDGRGKRVDEPTPTLTAECHEHLIESHLCILRKNMDCKKATEPIPTITTSAGHFAQVVTYLQKVEGNQDLKNWDKVRRLLNDYAGYNIKEDEILILEINGVQNFIADIGMRMFKAEELKLAQGFPEDYIIDIEPYIGKKYSEAKQIARLGNAVCPQVATALIRANLEDMAYRKPLHTVKELNDAICE